MTESISNSTKTKASYSKKWGLDFTSAAERLKKIVNRTPLMYNHNLSKKYDCNIFLKREDLQVVRSYKLRGAYNMMSTLSREQLQRGVVCA
ncbi:MAG: pyridoxal-phosphate dependent enzyme, partial [Ginsengibacter sp.]